MRNIWEGSDSYFSPSTFKASIGKFAPQFAGYQQHDSQELLMYLLDGIHEDLNRVKKKPYVENPDYEGQSDEVWAAESWDRYKLRNDSIIVDWFQGQIKSKLICPECRKESVVFDPFMCLSLPLPQKNTVNISFVLHTNDMSKQHFRGTIQIKKTLSVLELLRMVENMPVVKDVNPPVKWDTICARTAYRGIPDRQLNRQLVSSLEREDLQLFTLTGVEGSRDVFAMVAKNHAASSNYGYGYSYSYNTFDPIIGFPFLLPLTMV